MSQTTIRLDMDCHRRLILLSLKRSVDLGRRVTVNFIIKELLDMLEEREQEKKAQGE